MAVSFSHTTFLHDTNDFDDAFGLFRQSFHDIIVLCIASCRHNLIIVEFSIGRAMLSFFDTFLGTMELPPPAVVFGITLTCAVSVVCHVLFKSASNESVPLALPAPAAVVQAVVANPIPAPVVVPPLAPPARLPPTIAPAVSSDNSDGNGGPAVPSIVAPIPPVPPLVPAPAPIVPPLAATGPSVAPPIVLVPPVAIAVIVANFANAMGRFDLLLTAMNKIALDTSPLVSVASAVTVRGPRGNRNLVVSTSSDDELYTELVRLWSGARRKGNYQRGLGFNQAEASNSAIERLGRVMTDINNTARTWVGRNDVETEFTSADGLPCRLHKVRRVGYVGAKQDDTFLEDPHHSHLDGA